MNRHHRLCLSVPYLGRARSQDDPKLANTMIGAVLLCAVLAVGCGTDGVVEEQADGPVNETPVSLGSSDDSSDDEVRNGADEEVTVPSDRLSFGDPADYGFAPVADEGIEPPEQVERDEQTKPEEPAELPALSAPEVVIPEISQELASAPEVEEVLDSIEVIDIPAQAPQGQDVEPPNSPGEVATLDDEASLACANVEIALGHFDEGRASIAAERMALASQHAASSGQAGVQDWSAVLGSVGPEVIDDDLAVLVGFIAACAERGYEL